MKPNCGCLRKKLYTNKRIKNVLEFQHFDNSRKFLIKIPIIYEIFDQITLAQDKSCEEIIN